MELEDTMCKLMRTEEDMSTLMIHKAKQVDNSSIGEYMQYHQTSLENVAKQKDGEIEKLKYIIFLSRLFK